MLKRLLCIVGKMDAGGAENMLMKLYRTVDKKRVQFDFACFTNEEGFFDKEILSMGGRIFRLGTIPLKNYPYKRIMSVYDFFQLHKYDYVLQSTEQAHMALFSLIAKIAGVDVIAMRATNSSACRGRLFDNFEKCLRFLPCFVADVKFAPSKLSADFLFGRNADVQILNNGINITKFQYNENLRRLKRKEFLFQNKLVIGHIGRFSKQKNHIFVIDVFVKILEKNSCAIFLLIGTGELYHNIKKYVDALGITDRVIFAGVRKDVSELMMAMDSLVFPSFYEGMPNVVIEAQTTGLPCLVSDTITEECKVTDKVEFLSLKNSALEWANKALSMINNDTKREDYAGKMKVAGYDIKDVAKTFLNSMKLV